MDKLDLKKVNRHLYAPSAQQAAVVDVPPASFLMIDGKGDPNTARAYAEAVQALYALAYALKFKIKKRRDGIDYAVMPLEGLWWVEDMRLFSVQDKGAWLWTMMILQPEFITAELYAETAGEVQRKKDVPALDRVRLEVYHEGESAQILHLGSYADEAPTIARLHDFIHQNGWSRSGKHHEIYLNDPRKAAPEKLRTVIRQPFKR